MKIRKNKPFIYPLLKLFFPAITFDRVIITFNGVVYSKNELTERQIVHEQVHIEQQRRDKFWLIKYIFSKRYRYELELSAYKKEWSVYHTEADRMAHLLSSPLYGNVVDYYEAFKQIKQ